MTRSDAAFTLERRGLELRFRSAVLAGRVWETDSYLRVRMRGAELEGFSSPACDDHIRLFFPDGPVLSLDEMRDAPSREYTPVAWADDWLDVEFALHGGGGVAAEWAARAAIGTPVGVGGPRGSMLLDGVPTAWFLAGDETAVPAIRRFTASMSPDAVGHVLIEVPDDAHHLAVDVPRGVRLAYVHRGDRRGGTALAAHLDALTADDRPAGDLFAFIASEQGIVRPGRALALDRWGLDAERIVVKGYWKRGDDTFHAPH